MTAITIERFETLIVDLPTIRPHKLAMHTLPRSDPGHPCAFGASDGITGTR
ncbi:muconate cycloisomerase, partial [Pseudomonas syringae pv. actinidifoliorum]|nr:muconate cycloisomerase [Pseudomonas syringae pv. actinidifoliorum]